MFFNEGVLLLLLLALLQQQNNVGSSHCCFYYFLVFLLLTDFSRATLDQTEKSKGRTFRDHWSGSFLCQMLFLSSNFIHVVKALKGHCEAYTYTANCDEVCRIQWCGESNF